MAADNENAEAVERALTRMDDLINQILTLAREGQPVEQWDAVSLSSVAKGSWEMVETDTAELRVDDDLAFKADPARLKRLFENLFRNALDHGGPDVTVTVGALSDKPGSTCSTMGPVSPRAMVTPCSSRDIQPVRRNRIWARYCRRNGHCTWVDDSGDRERDRWCSLRDSRCRIRGVNRLTGPVFFC